METWVLVAGQQDLQQQAGIVLHLRGSTRQIARCQRRSRTETDTVMIGEATTIQGCHPGRFLAKYPHHPWMMSSIRTTTVPEKAVLISPISIAVNLQDPATQMSIPGLLTNAVHHLTSRCSPQRTTTHSLVLIVRRDYTTPNPRPIFTSHRLRFLRWPATFLLCHPYQRRCLIDQHLIKGMVRRRQVTTSCLHAAQVHLQAQFMMRELKVAWV
jgi:hypothetical protein